MNRNNFGTVTFIITAYIYTFNLARTHFHDESCTKITKRNFGSKINKSP